jgi:acetyl-CoA synthetase
MTETHMDVPSSYPPPAEFAANANATADLYKEAESDRLAFWAEQARRLSWDTPFSDVLDWSDAPVAKWFIGGRLNVAYNCVDRHVEAGHVLSQHRVDAGHVVVRARRLVEPLAVGRRVEGLPQ